MSGLLLHDGDPPGRPGRRAMPCVGKYSEPMGAAWYLARAELRRSWRGVAVVSILLGTLWGLSIGFAVGARRNATAFQRMATATRAVHLLVNAQFGAETKLDFDAVRRLPEVAEWDGIDGYFALVNSDRVDNSDNAALWLSVRKGALTTQFERTILYAGRRLNMSRADEVLVNPEFTRKYRLRVGDAFTFSMADPRSEKIAAHRRMHIVGVVRMSDEAVKEGGAGGLRAIMTPAFYRANKRFVGYWSPAVRLRPGTDIEKFKRHVNALVPTETIVYQSLPGVAADVDRANRPQVLALIAFATILGVGTLIATIQVIGQLATRRRQRRRATLLGIGGTPAQAAVSERLAVAPALLTAALTAMAVATVVSARFPVGVVGRVEIHRGPALHLGGLAFGLLTPVAIVLAATEVFARRGSRRATARSRRPRSATRITGSWPLALAVRNVRQRPWLLAATTVACALAVGALVFAASLGSFVANPSRFGWRWDTIVQTDVPGADPGDLQTLQQQQEDSYVGLRNAPGIAAASIIRSGQMPIGQRGALTSVVGFRVLHGDAIPQILAGRMPTALGEIAVGLRITRADHKSIGDLITVGDGPTRTRLRIVGTVALPGLGFYSGNDAPPVGGSAVVSLDQFAAIIPAGANTYGLARYDPSVLVTKRHALVEDALHLQEGAGLSLLDGIRRNVDVVALADVRRTPLLLVAALTALGLATLVQALFVEARRRRPALAVLAVLGAKPSRVRRLVTSHALLVVGASMTVGCTVGVVLGRLAWGAVATSIGIRPHHVLPVRYLLASFAASLLLGVAAAWLPSRFVGGRPVAVLRSG